uniref:Uncharacterized protein n=1 Tax=Oryza sativa subsp. japonica TaxID=39947 RepID=Q6K6N5_ORYSJ|nr:hypothetical protein [Oryza sativa Japonica Group]BAD19610.1 hypothetical protein [Oryza sativa Japonica Group]
MTRVMVGVVLQGGASGHLIHPLLPWKGGRAEGQSATRQASEAPEHEAAAAQLVPRARQGVAVTVTIVTHVDSMRRNEEGENNG